MWWEWLLGVVLFSFYIVCLFTVCRLTFEKGYTILGLVGIFMPFLWLIGAILPAKQGSRFDVAQRMSTRFQHHHPVRVCIANSTAIRQQPGSTPGLLATSPRGTHRPETFGPSESSIVISQEAPGDGRSAAIQKATE